MKKITICIVFTLVTLMSYAQKKSPQLPGSNTLSDEEMERAFKNISGMTSGLIDAMTEKEPVKLNSYYKADDGSLVYVRQIGKMVYALADRYDRRFSSLWIGEINGSNLKVKYFYFPKGEAQGTGNLNFKVSGHGRSQRLALQKTGAGAFQNFNFKNAQVLTRLPSKIPIDDRAWCRGNTRENMSGRYKVANVGKHYILDLDGKIISYAVGSRPSTHGRPQFSAIFIGEKNGTRIEGAYVDLPLGHTTGGGKTAFDIVGQHYLRTDRNYFFYGFEHERAVEDKRKIIQ